MPALAPWHRIPDKNPHLHWRGFRAASKELHPVSCCPQRTLQPPEFLHGGQHLAPGRPLLW